VPNLSSSSLNVPLDDSQPDTPDPQPNLPPDAKARWGLRSLSLPPENILLALAALIGVVIALTVVVFGRLLGWIRHLFQSDLYTFLLPLGSSGALFLLPVVGGLLVALLLWIHPIEKRGIAAVLQAATRQGERIPLARIPYKVLATSLSLGAGASLGPEGPTLEIGGILGSALGQRLRFSRERITLLMGAGVAAGLAAGFNAPIAGVFMALELVLTRAMSTVAISVVVLAAVVAAMVAQVSLGSQPVFTVSSVTRLAMVVPDYEWRTFLELPFYLGLGLAASLVSAGMGFGLRWGQQLFAGTLPGWGWMSRIPTWGKPILGGALIGLGGLALPLALGVGYETTESLLQNIPFSLGILLALLVGKILLTAISMGCGLIGNSLGPALFVGAVLGSAYHEALTTIGLPTGLQLAPQSAYALVGMAAVWAGTVRAPLTAILLLFEVTREYRLVLPLMAAVGVCSWATQYWQSPGIYPAGQTRISSQEGSPTVADAMGAMPLVLDPQGTVLDSALQMLKHRCYGAIIEDERGHLAGILTLQDIEIALEQGSETMQVQELAISPVVTAWADEPLSTAAERMALRDLRQLPVVSRQDPRVVIGFLLQDQITLAERLLETQQTLLPYLTHT